MLLYHFYIYMYRLLLLAGHFPSSSSSSSPLEDALSELEALFVAKVVVMGVGGGGLTTSSYSSSSYSSSSSLLSGGVQNGSRHHHHRLKRPRGELSHLLSTCIASSGGSASSGTGTGSGAGSGSDTVVSSKAVVVVQVNGHFRRGLLAALASPAPVPWHDPAKPLKVAHVVECVEGGVCGVW